MTIYEPDSYRPHVPRPAILAKRVHIFTIDIYIYSRTMSGCECLILGPEGVGKTLLLKKLLALRAQEGQKRSSRQSGECPTTGVLPTIPTVGTNLEQLSLGKKLACSLREYGSSMAPLWRSAYEDCCMVLYMVDTSNPTQIAAATVLLLEVLSSSTLKDKPFLIFFNKQDSAFRMSLVELKSIMRLDDIVESAGQPITIVHGSCTTNEGLGDILQWLTENTQQWRTKN